MICGAGQEFESMAFSFVSMPARSVIFDIYIASSPLWTSLSSSKSQRAAARPDGALGGSVSRCVTRWIGCRVGHELFDELIACLRVHAQLS